MDSENYYKFENNTNFPIVRNGVVCSANFETCKDNKLNIELVSVIDKTIEDGFVKKGWWIIRTPNLPDRYVNMYMGRKSMERLLKNYGFSDDTGCVHYKKGKIYTVPNISHIKSTKIKVPRDVMDIIGIPQRLENSGICWYAATCFAFFYCKQIRELVTSKMYKDPELVNLCNNCLKSSEISEKLRRKLWFDYAFGDKIGQRPEDDGQNGLTQFCIIASKFDIPVLRFFVNNGNIIKLKDPVHDQNKVMCPVRDVLNHPKEPHILVVRFYRGDNHTTHKPTRRFRHNGVVHKLASMLLGSMHCGHQIGASSYNLEWRRWAISDSDASMFGMGPVHFCTDSKCKKNKDEWWSYWRHMIPLTVFGSQKSFCDLSPHNRPTGELENKPKVSDVGDLNLDLIYISS
jgi:hypothetical protein